MKIRNFVLITAFSLLCLAGCSCNNEQPHDSSGATPPDEPVYQETTTIISVNHDSVTFCVGESFTLVAESTIDGAQFIWAIDGDADEDIVSISQTGNSAVITANKVGETKLVASVQEEGYIYFRTVDVKVNEPSDVVLVVSDNVGFDGDGYHVALSTMETQNGDKRSIAPNISPYKNNKFIPYDEIQWISDDENVVMVEGSNLLAVSEGETTVIAKCVIEGKTYTLPVSVTVYRPTVTLDEKFVVERENLSVLAIDGDVKGVPRGVVYEGETVGSYNAGSKTVTLEKSKLPTASALMGENRRLTIETNLANYVVSVDLYTKIIQTKEEFENFSSLAKAANSHAALWDGYFVLGADIAYNDLFKSKLADIDSLWAAVEGDWSNGGLYGFKGVFDGKGYNIEGISIDNGANTGSIFGVLHIEGVVKNISFTKASVAANASFVCSAGGGTVENIYIQYDEMGKGVQHYEDENCTIVNNYCASFFGFKEPTLTANVSNCVIDVTKAKFNAKTEIKIVGSEYASIKNVFVIGGTKSLQDKSNATLTYAYNIDFAQDQNVQNRYNTFSADFWSKEQGIPVPHVIYNEVSTQDVQLFDTVSCLAAGTSYALSLNNNYVRIESNSADISVLGNILTVSQDAKAQNGVQITITSVFDSSKSVAMTCDIATLDREKAIDLTAESNEAFYDVTEQKVYLAELGAEVKEEILYYTNPDGSVFVCHDDGLSGEILAVSASKFYKLKYVSVTKVIDEAEDLHAIRKDYTVISHNKPGCYDGLLDGTFVLINDIDCEGLQLKDTGKYWENSRGFAGTFDGRGYTISNLSVSKNGLFGVLSYATIKNVKFEGVKLKEDSDKGTYVALFATRAFNSLITDVSIHYAEYVAKEESGASSGLMIYETTYDCTFQNITLDISDVTGVKCVAEAYYYEADGSLPKGSNEKSVYKDITVLVSNLDDTPDFAYKRSTGEENDVIDFPDGSFTFKQAE